MSDSPATEEGKPERKAVSRLSPFSLLGWVLGGLSLLNLIEELSPLKILGKLKTWLDAYTSIVDDAGTFLFGWIDFKWIAIDQLEVHVLVIATIVASAYVRAEFSELRSQGNDPFDAIGGVLGGVIVIMWMIFLPTLLLPFWFALVGAAIMASFLFLPLLFHQDEREGSAFQLARSFLRELVGVVAVCLILVALNYTVFR